MVGLVLGAACCQGGSSKKTNALDPKERDMNIEDIANLPFGIDKNTPLDQVEILLAFYSAKTGAGRQEITLRGDGLVRLYFSRSSQDKTPKILESNCGSGTVMRLLDLMEGLGL